MITAIIWQYATIMRVVKSICILFLLATSCTALASLPPQDLGLSNIQGGGPLRPSPGLYWFQYFQYYQANKLMDARGQLEPNSPDFKAFYVIPSLVYQGSRKLLGGEPGFTFYMFFATYYKTKHGDCLFNSTGAGIGDTTFGPYIQWPMIYRANGDPLFAHRFEFDVNIPTGRNKEPIKYFNVAAGFFYLTPYWTGTLYFHRHLALSWRLYYIWSAKSHRTNIKTGDAINLNFSLEWECKKDWWIAFCGYLVDQFKLNRRCGKDIPGSKERVLGLGPGVLYYVTDRFQLLSYVYWETLARNRTQGVTGAFRFIWHFDVYPVHA